MMVNNRLPEPVEIPVPRALFAVWKQFELDQCTGNVHLNFKDGRLLGWRVETVHSNK